MAPDPATSLRTALRFATRSLAPSTARVDGITLALYRTAAGVSAADVARALDASKQYIGKLEARGALIETAGRYRAAVDAIAAEDRA